MKKVLLSIAVAGFIALLVLPPRQQESLPSRPAPTRVSYSGQGSLYNAVANQPAASNGVEQGGNRTFADLGSMPEFNPPHGQPWHRCEIPVGAPLNSTPQNNSANMNQTLAQPNPSATQTNSGVKPKLNPPHGQPWHRCDIAVGAPLDSPPQSTTTQTVANSAASNPEIITPIIPSNPIEGQANQPVVNNQTPENSGPKPALNPPHGQPWHRCDIKVGDPLP